MQAAQFGCFDIEAWQRLQVAARTRVDLLQVEIRRILAGRAPARRPPGMREMRVVDPVERKKSDAALARARAARAEKAKTVMH